MVNAYNTSNLQKDIWSLAQARWSRDASKTVASIFDSCHYEPPAINPTSIFSTIRHAVSNKNSIANLESRLKLEGNANPSEVARTHIATTVVGDQLNSAIGQLFKAPIKKIETVTPEKYHSAKKGGRKNYNLTPDECKPSFFMKVADTFLNFTSLIFM
ncbi:MAG: hypothetical protein ACLFQV_03020 [Vulcanimicrobiota bacterium]